MLILANTLSAVVAQNKLTPACDTVFHLCDTENNNESNSNIVSIDFKFS